MSRSPRLFTRVPAMAVAALMVPATGSIRAQDVGAAGADDRTIATRATTEVRYEQRLGQTIPPGLTFVKSTGERVDFDSLLSARPTVLVMAYYRCPMLCTLVLNAAVDALKEMSLQPGDDYGIVVLSIDPRETPELAAQNKRVFVDRFDREVDPGGVHFLTGRKTDIDAAASAVGFRYVFDPESGQFAHPSGIVIVTPQRKISKYFLGVEYSPRDVRLGLVEASQGRIGTVVDQVLLLCYQYDPTTGKYGLIITNVLRLGGTLTVVIILGGISLLLWRERRARRHDDPDQPSPALSAEGPVV